MTPIQGKDAVLSFDNGNGFVPAVCTESVAIAIDTDTVESRTVGDGDWKKPVPQINGFSMTLSGVMVFDNGDGNNSFKFWDILQNQSLLLTMPFRLTFTDAAGNIKSMQGVVLIKGSNINGTVGQVVKGSFQLLGQGKPLMFDGIVPCPTSITAIAVAGQTSSDGTVTITYTYTGDVYQVKYRFDNTGSYAIAIVGTPIVVPGLSINRHTVEVIPICLNGYSGAGMSQQFDVTKGNACASVVTGIEIHTPDSTRFSGLSSGVTVIQDSTTMYIVPVITGPALTYGYAWDDTSNYTFVPVGTKISINDLSPGAHTLAIGPVCSFGPAADPVWGTGLSVGFTLLVQPQQSILSYNYTNFPPSNQFSIYVNNVLVKAFTTANGSGTINVANGASVRAVLTTSTQPVGSRSATMTVTDTTTSTQLYNHSGPSPSTLSFTFTANGDAFAINAVVSA